MSTRKDSLPAARGALRTAVALLLAAALPAATAALPAAAQSIVSTGQSFVSARLLPGSMAADGTRMAGLALELAPGWKTYWRAPGEAGVPPVFDWSGSENLARAEVLWPRPQAFESFGLTTLGYGGAGVVLPVRLVPEDPAAPIALRLGLDIGVCRDLCVMEHAELSASLPPGAAGGEPAIAGALEAQPARGDAAGLVSARCRISGTGAERGFEAEIGFAGPLGHPVVAVEGGPGQWFHSVEWEAEDGRLSIRARLALDDPAAWIPREAVRLTVVDGGWAAEIHGCAAPGG